MMYRSGSFASSSQFSIRSTGTSSNDKEVRQSQDDGRMLYLKSKGNLPLKTLAPTTGGRIMTLCNYPVRNRQWNMELVCVHPTNGGFAIADERGQIFYLSIEKGLYQSVRCASTKILAMCFLPNQKTHLMLAYETGSHVIVDALTSDVVGSFQCPFNYGAVKMLAAHPKEPLVAMVQGNYTLVLWNLV
ncbi:hypothetical protein EON64_03735 [archaeon]|nr:MAG: hypothetical protein EON64_03735 [archaeon]